MTLSVLELRRYPVKSLGGEELESAAVTTAGLLGDRAFALIDAADGTVISAKNPRKWPTLLALRATFPTAPQPGAATSPVSITLPDGTAIRSDQPDAALRLSSHFGHEVQLRSVPPERPAIQMLWPDLDDRGQEKMTREDLPAGTFFDLAPVHLVTTATLNQLSRLNPAGRFDIRRFRPNLVLELDTSNPFPECEWVGRSIVLGEGVRLKVTQPCPRCIMTTLPQGDLPRDPAILKSIVVHNQGNLGVYAVVEQGGTVRRGDRAEVV